MFDVLITQEAQEWTLQGFKMARAVIEEAQQMATEDGVQVPNLQELLVEMEGIEARIKDANAASQNLRAPLDEHAMRQILASLEVSAMVDDNRSNRLRERVTPPSLVNAIEARAQKKRNIFHGSAFDELDHFSVVRAWGFR